MVERQFFGETFKINTRDLIYWVYIWMFIGLLVTAGTSYFVAQSTVLFNQIITNNWIFFGLMAAQLALVIIISRFLSQLPFALAAFLFLLYSALTGVTLSSIFFYFTLASLATTFAIVAITFGVMSLYGYYTRADLTTMGNILLMVLVGLIVATLANLYFGNSMLELLISAVGVVVFSMLTAYDIQKIKYISQQLMPDSQTFFKVALFGALTLYLDFINLFLMVLNFTGQRRQE